LQIEQAKCNTVCGQLLECGHPCWRKCHECEEAGAHADTCRATCTRTLPCGHECAAKHPCRESCPPCQRCACNPALSSEHNRRLCVFYTYGLQVAEHVRASASTHVATAFAATIAILAPCRAPGHAHTNHALEEIAVWPSLYRHVWRSMVCDVLRLFGVHVQLSNLLYDCSPSACKVCNGGEVETFTGEELKSLECVVELACG
jgi:hypothetical protein